MDKLKISDLLKESGAFVFTYNKGLLFTKEGSLVKDEEKQKTFATLLNGFGRKEKMFEFLSDAKVHLNSTKPSVGFFVQELDKNAIQITRLYFIMGISMSLIQMGGVNYQLFFNKFIDLEGREIVVKDPEK